jgi:CMP-2-keto-3-deoxyoctulosonic acid synthetase
MRIVAVIPARLASTRLPGKVLLPIAGVPMLGWVYRAALACPQLDKVLIATDSSEVVAYADSEGWSSVMTSPDLPSGTDRVHALSELVDADIYVNHPGRRTAAPPGTHRPLEMTERLEQLRLLENGINIYVEHTTFTTIGVDTEADLLAAERVLQQLAQS